VKRSVLKGFDLHITVGPAAWVCANISYKIMLSKGILKPCICLKFGLALRNIYTEIKHWRWHDSYPKDLHKNQSNTVYNKTSGCFWLKLLTRDGLVVTKHGPTYSVILYGLDCSLSVESTRTRKSFFD